MSLTGRGHDTFLCRPSQAKKPESGLFCDWIANNTDDLRCSDWPKCCHPLIVDFSLHFCLRNEQWIHTRVRNEISAGSVFLNLNLKNALIEVSSIEIFSISSYTKKLPSNFTDHLNAMATSYRSDKQVHFSNNPFMNEILTWFDCNSSFRNLRIILSDLRFHNTFQFVKYVTLHRNLMLKVKARARHACTTRLACRRSRIYAY